MTQLQSNTINWCGRIVEMSPVRTYNDREGKPHCMMQVTLELGDRREKEHRVWFMVRDNASMWLGANRKVGDPLRVALNIVMKDMRQQGQMYSDYRALTYFNVMDDNFNIVKEEYA